MNRRHFLMSTAVMAGGAAVRGLASPNDTVRMGVVGLRRPRRQPRQRVVEHAERRDRRRSATSTKSHIGEKLKTLEAQGPARSRRPTSTCASCSRTRPSTRSRSPRRTTGTRCRRSGPARPARTSTSRSRARTTSSRRSRSSPRPASTTASSSTAARAGRHRRCGKRSQKLTRAASSARSTWRAASATSGATPSARRRSQPVPAGVDYDLWTGPAPKREFTKNRFHYNWHWFWDTGNGDLGNQGIHEVDIARWGLGVTHPTKVSAIGGKFMFDDDQETPNTISASYEFDVDGKKKMMTFEVRHWISPHEAGIDERQAGQHHRQPVLRLEGLPRHRQLQQVLLVPGQGADAGAGGDQEGRALGQLHRRGAQPQARGSERRDRGRRAVLQPDAPGEHQLPPRPHAALGRRRLQCIGDDEANKMLTRDYRAPFVVPKHV